jgi:hypothetical protein
MSPIAYEDIQNVSREAGKVTGPSAGPLNYR